MRAQEEWGAGWEQWAPAACVPGSHTPPVATDVALGVTLDLTLDLMRS